MTPVATAPDRSLPIAMFDSGVGGLTVLHECLVSLPAEDFLYLGDSANFPYGTKTVEELRGLVVANAKLLLERGAKLLIVACNSATSAGAEVAREIAAGHGVEVVTVIDPEAEIAAAITESGRVGVLATPATVEGGAYRRALGRQGRGLEVTEVAAPDLAPIIQSGFPFDQSVVATVRSYCEPLKAAGDRHIDPRLHPLPAGRADAAANARPRRAAGQRRACDRRLRPADPRISGPRERGSGGGGLPVPLHGRRRIVPRARHPVPADAARRRRARLTRRVSPSLLFGRMSESILVQIQADTRAAMKAGDRDRVGTLRMITNSLQQNEKEGDGDAVAVLQRERKKRIEAAEAFASGGRPDQAEAERGEAALIETYLPEQISDEELGSDRRRCGRPQRCRLGQGDGQGDRDRDGSGEGARRRQAGLDDGAGAAWRVGS